MSHSVLLCDDALFMRTVLREIFTRGGYTVAGEAENGEEAVQKYASLRPDVVTMDLIMPGMGGVETIRELLRLDPAACIVVCSAMNQDALLAQALAAGAREYIVKPFQATRVLQAVTRALEVVAGGAGVPRGLP